jgi:hypothetical protein
MTRFIFLLALTSSLLLSLTGWTEQPTKPKGKPLSATPAESLKIAKDFKAELIYSVPKDIQGSWVNMCVDPKGRLIVSDQYGPLYRITPGGVRSGDRTPAGGDRAQDVGETKVEKLDLKLGGAHGLVWAFDSLYVMVNEGVNFGGKKLGEGCTGFDRRTAATRLKSRSFSMTLRAPANMAPMPSFRGLTANLFTSSAAT